jgi:CheY-like chemotaxis protein
MSPRHNMTYRVLVVDDDPSVLATYRRLLRRQGYVTVAEADPQRVLDNGFEPESFDLLLLDYKMPSMDGLTLLAKLRRRECGARCILLSAFINDEVRSQATNLGVDRILEKPVGVAELRRALNELLPITKQPPGARVTVAS